MVSSRVYHLSLVGFISGPEYFGKMWILVQLYSKVLLPMTQNLLLAFRIAT